MEKEQLKGYTAELDLEWTESDATKHRKHAPLTLALAKGTFGFVNNPNVVSNGFVAFQPYIIDERGCRPMEINPRFKNVVQIPLAILKRGTTIRKQPLVKQFDPTVLASTNAQRSSPLRKLITTFFDACIQSGSSLMESGVSENQIAFLNANKIRLVSAMIGGFERADTFEIFRNGLPSLKEFVTKCKSHKDLTPDVKSLLADEFIIYANVYWIEADDTMSGMWYWGETAKGINRSSEHARLIYQEERPLTARKHYDRARRLVRSPGGNWGWFPVMRVPRTDFENNRSGYLVWAEQAVIALFKSYNSGLWCVAPDAGSSDHLWSAELSKKFDQLTKDIFDKNPDLDVFDTQNMKGLLGGLNWSSPVLEQVRKLAGLWVRTTVFKDGKKHMYVFTGPARRVQCLQRRKNVTHVSVNFFSRYVNVGDKMKQDIFHPTLRWIKDKAEIWPVNKGDMMIPIVEIMAEEYDVHPNSWAALPTVGAFDSWHNANRVAYRVEYTNQQTKKLESRYLYPRHNFAFVDLDESHGSEDERFCLELRWANGMATCAAFSGWDWKHWEHPSDGLRSWLIKPWSVRIKVAEYDFLEQKLTVSELQRKEMPRPQLLSFDQTMARLKSDNPKIGHGRNIVVGVNKIGLMWDEDGKVWGTGRGLEECDSCWLITCDENYVKKSGGAYTAQFRGCNLIADRTTGTGKSCMCEETGVSWEYDGTKLKVRTCSFCRRLRRYCTYTIGETMLEFVDTWKKISLPLREGTLCKTGMVIERPTGVSNLVYDGADDDPDATGDDEMPDLPRTELNLSD